MEIKKILSLLLVSLPVYQTKSNSTREEIIDFPLKVIQRVLQETTANENFVISPVQALNLYKNLQTKSNNEMNRNFEFLTTSSPLMDTHNYYEFPIKNTTLLTSDKDLWQTVTLKARWSFNFQTRDIRKCIFQHPSNNTKIKQIYVDFMRKDDIFRSGYLEPLEANILELPLQFKSIKFFIILPKYLRDLSALRRKLYDNPELLHFLNGNLMKMKLVRVLVPKFQISYKWNMKSLYEEVYFENLNNYASILQSCGLLFNEYGVGRFETTTVLFWNIYSYLRLPPTIFDINQPFLFMITDKDGIQFFGQVFDI
uniref:Serpin domain-containing protein n=1 Tax=Glossina brevipalpis TaxID=37001 RepID=A0A1A9WA49_9MUSC